MTQLRVDGRMAASAEEGGRHRDPGHAPLGRLLVERGLLAEEPLADALAEQATSRRPLGEILVARRLVRPELVAQALATQHGGLMKTEYGYATGFAAAEHLRAVPGPPSDSTRPEGSLQPSAAVRAQPASKVSATTPAPSAEIRDQPSGPPARRSLVSLLVEAGVASEQELQLALAEGESRGERLGEVVVRRGWLDEVGLARMFAHQWKLPFLGEPERRTLPAPSRQLSPEDARRLGACTFETPDGTLAAVADPTVERFSELTRQLGEAIYAVTTPTMLADLLAELEAPTGQDDEAAQAAADHEDRRRQQTIEADLDVASAALEALRAHIEPLQTARRQTEHELAAARIELDRQRATYAQQQAAMHALEQQVDEQHQLLTAVKDTLADLTSALEARQASPKTGRDNR